MFNGTLDQRLPNVLCKLVEGFMYLRVRNVLSLEEEQDRQRQRQQNAEHQRELQVCHLETNDASNLTSVALHLVNSQAQSSNFKLWTLAPPSQLRSIHLSTFVARGALKTLSKHGRRTHICLAEIGLIEDTRMFKCVKTISVALNDREPAAAQTETHCLYNMEPHETHFYLKFVPVDSWLNTPWQSSKMYGYAFVNRGDGDDKDGIPTIYVVAQVHDTSQSWLDEVLQPELVSELQRTYRRLWMVELDGSLALDDPALFVS